MSDMDRGEEFISLCVVVFDTEAGTLRLRVGRAPRRLAVARTGGAAPAGHRARCSCSTPRASFLSREIPLDTGDLVLLYTDGLAEARDGDAAVRRGAHRQHPAPRPRRRPDVLCKGLLEAARDFASGPISDDVAILAVRRG